MKVSGLGCLLLAATLAACDSGQAHGPLPAITPDGAALSDLQSSDSGVAGGMTVSQDGTDVKITYVTHCDGPMPAGPAAAALTMQVEEPEYPEGALRYQLGTASTLTGAQRLHLKYPAGGYEITMIGARPPAHCHWRVIVTHSDIPGSQSI